MTDADEPKQVRLRDGETWFLDAFALCERLGVEYLSQVEGGDIYVGIPGKGEVPLTDLLAAAGKRGNLASIK